MKILAVVLGVIALLVGIISYNVWRANNEPITSTPGAVETGRQKLHAQLDQTKKNEAQLEKQNWDSIAQLRILIKDHQDRIARLAGNKEASEIVAHDHDTIARLEKRITELEAQPVPQQAGDAGQPTTPSIAEPSTAPQHAPAPKPASPASKPE